MSTGSILVLAIVYTGVVACMVSLTDVSGAVVVAVAWAWFNLGRMVERRAPALPLKWGRQ